MNKPPSLVSALPLAAERQPGHLGCADAARSCSDENHTAFPTRCGPLRKQRNGREPDGCSAVTHPPDPSAEHGNKDSTSNQ